MALRFRIRFRRLGYLVVSLLMLACRVEAESGRISDAQERQYKAAREYYQGLKQLGLQATAQQKSDLYKKTMLPAQINMSSSLSQSLADRLLSIRKSIFLILKDKMSESKIPQWLLNPRDRASLGKGDGRGLGSETNTPNEPGLDGSAVPKEIEFPKRVKSRDR